MGAAFIHAAAGQRFIAIRGVLYCLPAHPFQGDREPLPKDQSGLDRAGSAMCDHRGQIVAELCDFSGHVHAFSELGNLPVCRAAHVRNISLNEILYSHSGFSAGRAALRQETCAAGFFASDLSTFERPNTTNGCGRWHGSRVVRK